MKLFIQKTDDNGTMEHGGYRSDDINGWWFNLSIDGSLTIVEGVRYNTGPNSIKIPDYAVKALIDFMAKELVDD